MGTIVRHEFLGNPWLFWLMCLTVVGIPLAVLHLFDGMVQVHEDVEDPAASLRDFRAGKH